MSRRVVITGVTIAAAPAIDTQLDAQGRGTLQLKTTVTAYEEIFPVTFKRGDVIEVAPGSPLETALGASIRAYTDTDNAGHGGISN